jgi:hypothetical protein
VEVNDNQLMASNVTTHKTRLLSVIIEDKLTILSFNIIELPCLSPIILGLSRLIKLNPIID